MTAFVEYRPSSRTAINFSVDNLLNTHAAASRLLFCPKSRDSGSIVDEFRDRDRHKTFQITIKQSFGGGGGTKVAKSN